MKKINILFIVLIFLSFNAHTQITLPTIFRDGMVLQRGKEIKVWGKVPPGKEILVRFNSQNKTTYADNSGFFSLSMNAPVLSHDPKTMKVKCESDSILINDILVGDVFLLSGQSNMEWEISKLDANTINDAITDANYPEIRYYKVAKNWINGSVYGNDGIADAPWVKFSASTAPNMSGIGFFYGRKLYKDKNVPIGLIDCSQGASYGEAWISQNYIDSHPELKPYLVSPVVGDPVTMYAQHYRNPGILYKKMLSRVLPYPVGGILWYQGEANAGTYNKYEKVLTAVIDNFRISYSDPALPFVIIQLSAYENPNFWPYTREIQDFVANSTPNAAMVSTIDVGSANSIHPTNKKPVGERCVLAMRKLYYDEDIVYSGPTYESVRFEGNKAIITFKHADGLKTNSNILAGFEICDNSYFYLPVTGAEISGNEISVWRNGINDSKAVRYGWSNFPPPNLYNSTNLPANPFRTTTRTTSEFTSNVFYVSTEGNDANEGTRESPFATIARATSVVNQDNTTIYVAPGTYVFNSTAVIMPYNQTIVGDDAANTIFDGNNAVSLIDGITAMQQSSGKKLELKKIKFKNGYLGTGAIPGGAAIRMGVQTNLHVTDCYFANNNSVTGVLTWGGAIYFTGNTLIVDRCFFEENTSMSTTTENAKQGYGGAIVVRHLHKLQGSEHTSFGATNAIIKNSTFYKNTGNTKGGAIYFNKQLDGVIDDDDATFVVQNCVFLDNKSVHGGPSAQIGAALALSSGGNNPNNKMQTIILTNNTFCNNNMTDATGNPLQRNGVLLEGFRYTSYMANNIITSSFSTAGAGLFANQKAPVEYGKNNTIDVIGDNINGTDFTTNAAAMNNLVVAVTPDDLKLSTTLSGYPIGTTFKVPYLEIGNTSPAVNGGVNSYVVNTIANPAPADPVEYVSQTDIQGKGIQKGVRDLGAWEHSEQSGIRTTDDHNLSKIAVYLHPIFGTLSVLTNVEIRKIQIFDMTGKMLYNVANKKTIMAANLTKGLYLIQVEDIDRNVMRLKFLKE